MAPPRRTNTRRDLEAAILEAPDDPAVWLVYADALQQRGDPRGELIARCHAGAGFEAYLAEHPDLVPPGEVTWRFGFVDRLTLDHPTRQDVVAAFSHPSCRFARELVLKLRLTRCEDPLSGLAARVRSSVHSLVLEQDQIADDEHDWLSAHDCASDHAKADLLWRQLPSLQRLEFRGGWDIFERLVHEGVEEIVIDGGAPFCAQAWSARAWRTPSLRRVVWAHRIDAMGLGLATTLFDFAAITGAEAPNLRELDLSGSSLDAQDMETMPLADYRLAQRIEQLEVLRLPFRALGQTMDEVARVVRHHAGQLARLREFGLTKPLDGSTVDLRNYVPGFVWI